MPFSVEIAFFFNIKETCWLYSLQAYLPFFFLFLFPFQQEFDLAYTFQHLIIGCSALLFDVERG